MASGSDEAREDRLAHELRCLELTRRQLDWWREDLKPGKEIRRTWLEGSYTDTELRVEYWDRWTSTVKVERFELWHRGFMRPDGRPDDPESIAVVIAANVMES